VGKTNYDLAFEDVIGVEGGFSNHKDDRGGATNFGITIKTLSNWRNRRCTVQDVKDLKIDEAKRIYKTFYWNPMKLDAVPHLLIQTLLFDQGVNRGTGTAVRELQAVISQMTGQNLKLDGDLGKNTLLAMASLDQLELAKEYVFDAQDDYISIMKKDPKQISFIAGWINRTQSLLNKVFKSFRGK
jgi:lysozyme family protein